jgi:glycosyltransferase involved in cell wall biosynthesis
MDNIDRSAIFKRYVRVVLKTTDRIICQGLFWKNYFTSLVGQHHEGKMTIVPNWIDVSRYSRGNNNAGPSVRFIYIGWLEKYKGIQDLIEAVQILKNKKMQFELHVYGDGRLKNWLQKFIATDFVDGSVVYHGWVTGNNKTQAIQEADVIVLPSHREGFPNALLEAMAYQKAVIVSAVGVVPEIINHQTNGLLFTSGSAEDLAAKINLMIEQPELRMKMAIQARETVTEKYSIESAVSTFRTIFKVD